MPDGSPSLTALVKRAIDERTWRETLLLLSTPHDPEALDKAEAALELALRELIMEETDKRFLALEKAVFGF